MRDSDLIIGIDLGTTALKGAVYDLSGQLLFSHSITYSTYHPKPGWAEQNPADWIRALVAILETAESEVDLSCIRALGICSQVNTHVFVDQSNTALMPAISWQDQRCADVAADLETIAQSKGLDIPVDSSALVSRAEWARRHHPDIWESTCSILSPKDYCIALLTGQVATDALSSIGLVTPQGEYNSQLDQLIPRLSEKLPPIRPITHVIGSVRHPAISFECPVVVGTMDAWASLYGSGTVDIGLAFQVAGTSEIVGALSARSRAAKGVVAFPAVDGAYLHAGPTQCGGDALAWFARSLDMTVDDVLDMATDLPPVRAPLIFLPHLMGERAPLWDPTARGAFIGLTKTHVAADMAYAVLEGVGFSVRQLVLSIEESVGSVIDSLRLSGGASRSNLWCQIKADILGRNLERVRNTDTGSFGASLLAAVGIDAYPDINTASRQAVAIDQVFIPNQERTRRYDELYTMYRCAYTGLKDIFAKMAHMN